MALREIINMSDPRLREKSKKVKQFGPQLKSLTDDMLETLRDAPGVGLAAPQLGILQRIFVAEVGEESEDGQEEQSPPKSYVLINPEIVKASAEMEEGEEGCLSIPGWGGLVNRCTSILVKAQDVHGKPFRIKAEGYLARVFQHEMDHLDAILFIDHITDREKLWQYRSDEAVEEEPETETA
jgi:peptide deformylase